MPAGEGLSTSQRLELRRTVATASQGSGLRFRVYLGPLAEGRASAIALLRELGADADSSVLVAVDPGARLLEIVTGRLAADRLDERACSLAALTMTSTFGAGDLVGGLRAGLLQLAENSRRPRSLHADQ